jgi:hypothetical protein
MRNAVLRDLLLDDRVLVGQLPSHPALLHHVHHVPFTMLIPDCARFSHPLSPLLACSPKVAPERDGAADAEQDHVLRGVSQVERIRTTMSPHSVPWVCGPTPLPTLVGPTNPPTHPTTNVVTCSPTHRTLSTHVVTCSLTHRFSLPATAAHDEFQVQRRPLHLSRREEAH